MAERSLSLDAHSRCARLPAVRRRQRRRAASVLAGTVRYSGLRPPGRRRQPAAAELTGATDGSNRVTMAPHTLLAEDCLTSLSRAEPAFTSCADPREVQPLDLRDDLTL